MVGMMRIGAVALLAGLAVTPAEAQFFFGEPQAAAQRPAPRLSPRATARPQAAAPRRQQSALMSLFDDDDDEPQARPSRSSPGAAGQRPRAGLAGAAVAPAVVDGGGRPAISPAAPPVVAFTGGQPAGSIVIDSSARALYYILPGNRAYRYSIAVGREGFGWAGTQRVSRVAAWPDWRPPAEMRQRDPRLPELMTGGVRNPLGAKAIYLGSTLYRIHGTNDARSIGTASSSGCFRMTNSNVLHLAQLVRVGTRVQVVRSLPRNVATAPRPQGERG